METINENISQMIDTLKTVSLKIDSLYINDKNIRKDVDTVIADLSRLMKKFPFLRDYDRLLHAKDAVRTTLDSYPSTVDMHDIGYWAKEVENLRKHITESL